jgi:hypothetical protein
LTSFSISRWYCLVFEKGTQVSCKRLKTTDNTCKVHIIVYYTILDCKKCGHHPAACTLPFLESFRLSLQNHFLEILYLGPNYNSVHLLKIYLAQKVVKKCAHYSPLHCKETYVHKHIHSPYIIFIRFWNEYLGL